MADTAAPVEGLQNTIYKQELQSFLREFVVSPPVPKGSALRTDPADVLNDIKNIFRNKGFLEPAALKEELIKQYFPNMDNRVHGLIATMNADRFGAEPMTGFMRKEVTGTLTGLGHLYAQTTGNPIFMVEADFSNMGGTNEYFRSLMDKANGAPVNLEDAFKHTDGSARLVAQTIKNEIERFGPNAKVFAVRSGGDELRLIVTGVEKNRIPQLTERIHTQIERHMAASGLLDHTHSKHPTNPVKNGFGAAVHVADMRDIRGDYGELIKAMDRKIEASKLELGYIRIGPKNLDAAQYEAMRGRLRETVVDRAPIYSRYPDLLDTAVNERIGKMQELHENLARLKPNSPSIGHVTNYRDAELAKLNAPGAASAFDSSFQAGRTVTSPTKTGLFASTEERRMQLMRDYIKENNLQIKPQEIGLLEKSVAGLTPVDPASGVHMANDMPRTAGDWMTDTAALRTQLDPNDPKVRQALQNASLKPNHIQSLHPKGMGIQFHNLGGLNDQLGHAYSDKILRIMADDIKEELGKVGVKPGDYQIAHYGGGKFQLVIKPVLTDAGGNIKFVTDDLLNNVNRGLNERITALNQTRIAERFPDIPEKMRAKFGSRTFGDILDMKHRPWVNGMHVSTVHADLASGRPDKQGGHVLDELGKKLDNEVDSYRNAREIIFARNHPNEYATALFRQNVDAGKATPPDAAQGFKQAATHITKQRQLFFRIFDNLPTSTATDMPPEMQALIESKRMVTQIQEKVDNLRTQTGGPGNPALPANRAAAEKQLDLAQQKYQTQYDELKANGGLQEIADYMVKNPGAKAKTAPDEDRKASGSGLKIEDPNQNTPKL